MKKYLIVGGLVAVGFDATGAYLLVITHSGRGVFSTSTWERVARDYALAYPEGGIGTGIGPISGQSFSVTEMDFEKGTMRLTNQNGKIALNCESDVIAVEVAAT